MWTLVLLTLFANLNSGGGVATNVSTTLHFALEKDCLQAAKILEAKGIFADSASASYEILGRCIFENPPRR
jgi:hypothetical protein